MAEDQTPKTDFPSELVAPVKNFQDSLNKVNEIFEPLHSQPLQDLVSKNELDALSKAKLDTVSAFAVNNLVWMWLRTKGENPKDAGVLAEINRVKKSMYELVTCFHEF
jgi:exosome complex protein LRP1